MSHISDSKGKCRASLFRFTKGHLECVQASLRSVVGADGRCPTAIRLPPTPGPARRACLGGALTGRARLASRRGHSSSKGNINKFRGARNTTHAPATTSVYSQRVSRFVEAGDGACWRDLVGARTDDASGRLAGKPRRQRARFPVGRVQHPSDCFRPRLCEKTFRSPRRMANG
jgi:hypothetical protein